MDVRQRVANAKGWATFGVQALAAAATVAALGFLWAMLHDAEREGEAALLAALVGDEE